MKWLTRWLKPKQPTSWEHASPARVVREPISYQDFLKHIAPNLKRFEGIPPMSQRLRWNKSLTVGEALYQSTAETYREGREGYDHLMGACDAFMAQKVATGFCNHFQSLRAFHRAGYAKARFMVSSRHACSACMADDEMEIDVREWLALFARGQFPYPHPLPSDDIWLWCDGGIFIEIHPIKSSGDPEFDAWVDDVLRRVK